MSAVESKSLNKPPWYDRASDFFNAILIKEARQALKSRLFVTVFMLLLAVSWVVAVFLLLNSGDRLEYGSIGGIFFFCFYMVLAFAAVVVVPFNAFRSLLIERDLNTYELLSITTLSPRQIVWGKLLSSMVQLFLFYSAVTPFMAFSSLMQGFSAPSAAVVLVGTMLLSLQLSITALMLSTLARTRTMQGLITVAVLSMLVSSFSFTASRVYLLIARDSIDVANPDFWWVTSFVVGAAASYAVLFQKITISRLTFESDNRSTGIRTVASAQFWLLWIVFWSYMTIQNMPFNTVAVPILVGLSAMHWLLVGLFATTEGDFLSRRVRRAVPRNILWRILKAPFLPGGARGYAYVILHLVALWLIAAVTQGIARVESGGDFGNFVSDLYYLQSTSWTNPLRFATAACCYVAIYLGIATTMGRWGRSISAEVTPAHIRVLMFLLFVAGMFFPLLLRATEFIEGTQYTLFDITNPSTTIEEISNRQFLNQTPFDFSTPIESLKNLVAMRGYGDVALVLLMFAALFAVLFNAWAMYSGFRNLRLTTSPNGAVAEEAVFEETESES